LFHYSEPVQNLNGDALVGHFVQVLNPTTGAIVPIYLDANSTPIVTVSGVANMAKVDNNGMVDFYVGTSGASGYTVNVYGPDALTLKESVRNIPMIDLSPLINLTGMQNVATRTALASLLGVAGTAIYLTESGREGIFVFSSSNLSASVSADPSQYLYVAPATDPTGASGAWARKLDTTVGGGDRGTAASGNTDDLEVLRQFKGAADGTTAFYGERRRVFAQGTNNIDHARSLYIGTHNQVASPGVVANLDGIHCYTWSEANATATYATGIAVHCRMDANSHITNEADIFRAVSTAPSAGATIAKIVGFSVGDIGDATAVTTAVGVEVPDLQASSLAQGFRSLLNSGANKYAISCEGTAQSAFGGFVRVGTFGAPLYPLEVVNANANIVSDFNNSHATNPSGIRIRYSATAPNNSTNEFILCSDNVGTKFSVSSSGTITTVALTASSFVKSTGTAGIGYGTGAGGTVTQATNKSTGVTINKICGQITMNNAALAAGALVSFLVTNSTFVATDSVIVNLAGGKASTGTYECWIDGTGGGAFWITVKNISAGSLSEALVLNFAIIKGVAA